MVRMGIFVRILELRRQGIKKLQTARLLSIDVKTVRKYWEMSEKDYASYMDECKERSRIMNPYERFIIDKLKQFPDVSGAQIYDWLLESYKEFKPSYSTVRLHVRYLREREGILKASKVRQYQAVEELPFGQQAQVDMGSEWLNDMYGKRVRIYLFCMSMSASRYKYVYIQRTPFNSEDFIRAHDLGFRFFGGRTREIVYDQDRVLCVSENSGDILFTDKFRAYQAFAGFSVHMCRGYDPESKGKIEAVVKFVKCNFLKHRIFCGIDTLNSQALEWLDRTGNGQQHNTTKQIPKIVFLEEQKHLIAVSALSEETKPATYVVRKDNIISYRSNRYALPAGTYSPGKQVYVKEIEDTLLVTDESGNTIVKHTLCRERGKLIRLNHPERVMYTRHRQLFDDVLKAFGYAPQAKEYLETNLQKYPRYMKDQFSVFKKTLESYGAEEIARALDYCASRELFYATDFRDTLIYFQSLQPQPVKTEEFQIPDKYNAVTAQQRDISIYAKIYNGD